MSQQSTNAPHRQPTRKRVQRVVQQHQPQPHKQPTKKAVGGGFDGLTIALLLMNAVLIAVAVLS
jgi:hypothetical protein